MTLPSATVTTESQLGDMVAGILDVLFGYGVMLANAGIVSREQIAETMEIVLDQQSQRENRGATGRF